MTPAADQASPCTASNKSSNMIMASDAEPSVGSTSDSVSFACKARGRAKPPSTPAATPWERNRRLVHSFWSLESDMDRAPKKLGNRETKFSRALYHRTEPDATRIAEVGPPAVISLLF